MKKYVLFSIVIIFLVLVVVGFAYFIPKEKIGVSEQSIAESITELLSAKLNRSVDKLITSVIINTELFAKGSYNEPGAGGGLWFAAKTSKGWEIASVGNGIVLCEDISKYNFPNEIIPQCLDVQGGNKLIQR